MAEILNILVECEVMAAEGCHALCTRTCIESYFSCCMAHMQKRFMIHDPALSHFPLTLHMPNGATGFQPLCFNAGNYDSSKRKVRKWELSPHLSLKTAYKIFKGPLLYLQGAVMEWISRDELKLKGSLEISWGAGFSQFVLEKCRCQKCLHQAHFFTSIHIHDTAAIFLV